jgi:hypothetical protein
VLAEITTHARLATTLATKLRVGAPLDLDDRGNAAIDEQVIG